MQACTYPIPQNVTDGCDICTIGFTALEDLMTYTPSVETFEFLVDYICYIFPSGSQRQQCDIFMNQETDELIEWVNNSFPPQYICTIIGACNGSAPPVNGFCDVCDGAMTFIEQFVEFNDSEAYVEALLDYVCMLWPNGSAAFSECTTFVD
jgi:hypothetical protein